MDSLEKVLNGDERAVFALRSIYKQFGYSQYKMSKFEEYDLYVRNKDFLVSDNVITFTDTDGKLMALKPDVTLSIIKNDKESEKEIKKVYYNEHVYRVSKGTQSFKEITQVGLECLGDIDDYLITEVLFLAAKSLDVISEQSVLDISQLDVIFGIMEEAGLRQSSKQKIFSFLTEKNVQGIKSICEEEGVNEQSVKALQTLANLYGEPNKVFAQLEKLKFGEKTASAILNLKKITDNLTAMGVYDKIRIDFSVDSDVKYYNGVVFKGFASGIPTSVLSGGQYDKLMNKMAKKSKAIGFAVYLDNLDKLCTPENEYDVDVVIKYDDITKQTEIIKAISETSSCGESVLALKVIPEKLKYKRLVDLVTKEAK